MWSASHTLRCGEKSSNIVASPGNTRYNMIIDAPPRVRNTLAKV
jgi:hypothetical protein